MVFDVHTGLLYMCVLPYSWASLKLLPTTRDTVSIGIESARFGAQSQFEGFKAPPRCGF